MTTVVLNLFCGSKASQVISVIKGHNKYIDLIHVHFVISGERSCEISVKASVINWNIVIVSSQLYHGIYAS